MSKTKKSDSMTDASMRKNGELAMKELARWCHDHGPTWSPTNIIWRAAHGRTAGFTRFREPGLPPKLEPIQVAVDQLPPLIKACASERYFRDHGGVPESTRKPWNDFELTRTDYIRKIELAEYMVGMHVR